VQTILNYISITPRLQRPYRVTDELFDLSTMAMEYFKDRIESTLPGLAYFNKDFYTLPTTTKRRKSPDLSFGFPETNRCFHLTATLAISSDLEDSASNSPPQNHMVLRKGIRKIKQGMKMYNNQLSVLRTELRTCKRKAAEQSKQLAEQSNLLAEQQKQTLEYANRLDENDKKNEEMSRKFSTLLQVSEEGIFHKLTLIFIFFAGAQQVQDRAAVLAVKKSGHSCRVQFVQSKGGTCCAARGFPSSGQPGC